MASGRPIVSTPQPEQVLGYTDAVYISHSTQDFVDKCELALAEAGDEKENLRIAYARACSWDAMVREMETLLKKRGVFHE